MSEIIPEVDILIHTTIFLLQRGVDPYQFSIPSGKGIESEETKKTLNEAFGTNVRFSNVGSDIIGISMTEWGQIECKGAGAGKKQTHRNNFDRALASVVSYFEENTNKLPEKYRDAKPFLGLALPSIPEYTSELKKRVRKSLRQKLNLWILLYEPKEKKIRPISPNDDY